MSELNIDILTEYSNELSPLGAKLSVALYSLLCELESNNEELLALILIKYPEVQRQFVEAVDVCKRRKTRQSLTEKLKQFEEQLTPEERKLFKEEVNSILTLIN
jgi:hypothetical protein